MALRACVVSVLSLCLVKYDLSLYIGLCATLMLYCRRSLAVISDVVFMYGSDTVISVS